MNDKNKEVRKNFLVNRDETGKLVVNMYDGSNQKYYVEFIEPKGGVRTNWGSYNPSTGNIENKKGTGKYTGGIKAEDSVITEENGFIDPKIVPGGSYMWSVIQKHEAWKERTGFNK